MGGRSGAGQVTKRKPDWLKEGAPPLTTARAARYPRPAPLFGCRSYAATLPRTTTSSGQHGKRRRCDAAVRLLSLHTAVVPCHRRPAEPHGAADQGRQRQTDTQGGCTGYRHGSHAARRPLAAHSPQPPHCSRCLRGPSPPLHRRLPAAAVCLSLRLRAATPTVAHAPARTTPAAAAGPHSGRACSATGRRPAAPWSALHVPARSPTHTNTRADTHAHARTHTHLWDLDGEEVRPSHGHRRVLPRALLRLRQQLGAEVLVAAHREAGQYAQPMTIGSGQARLRIDSP